MNRKSYITALLALTLSAPIGAMPIEMLLAAEEPTTITMTVSGSNVRVCGAEGQTLEIYNLAGVKIKSIRIESADKIVSLNLSKGCYVLKVGDIARKMSIR